MNLEIQIPKLSQHISNLFIALIICSPSLSASLYLIKKSKHKNSIKSKRFTILLQWALIIVPRTNGKKGWGERKAGKGWNKNTVRKKEKTNKKEEKNSNKNRSEKKTLIFKC